MPLTMAEIGSDLIIQRIGGTPDIRQHLKDLGFVPGDTVTILTTMAGNIIVKIKEARIAISEEMAQKIYVQ